MSRPRDRRDGTRIQSLREAGDGPLLHFSSAIRRFQPESSEEVNTRHFVMRAGIVPYYQSRNGEIWILLGEEHRIEGAVLSDFGGGCNRRELPLDCALRELREESRDVVQVDLGNTTDIFVTGKKAPHQAILFVRMPFMDEDLSRRFAETSSDIPEENELDAINWYPYDTLKTISYRRLTESLRSLRPLLSHFA